MAEDVGGGEEGGGEAAESTGGPGSKVETHVAPAGVPAKFFDVTNGNIDHENWGKSTKELEGKLRTSKADMKAALTDEINIERLSKRPETVDGYKLEVPKGVELPEGQEWTFNEKDPMLGFWREFVHENGGDQEMFDKGLSAYINSALSQVPDYQAEVDSLGENGLDRCNAVNMWAKANLTEDTYSALESFAVSAKGIEALEEIMIKSGEPAFSPSDATGQIDSDTLLELQAKQADPRYWDVNKRDPRFVREVDQGFERLYGS